MTDTPLDAPPPLAPVERLAEARAEVEDMVEQARTRPPRRTGLFVGGPWHGTLRALPEPAPAAFPVAEPENALVASTDPAMDTATAFRTGVYTRHAVATPEVDGIATVDVWTYGGNIVPAYQELADAALRCLVRAGFLDHRFSDLSDRYPFGGTPGQQRPELRQRERCTPDPRPVPERYPDIIVQALARDLADQERERLRHEEGL